MKITELRSHTSIPESRKGRCTASNHLGKPNGFCPYTVRFRTSSELVAITSKQFTIDSCGNALLSIGEMLLVSVKEFPVCWHLREIMTLLRLTLQYRNAKSECRVSNGKRHGDWMVGRIRNHKR
jgi:hypothetical protein